MRGVGEYKPLKLLAEGKTKRLYQTKTHEGVLLEFKDDLTAGNGEKHDLMNGKGRINAKISAYLMKYLEKKGVKTHFLKFVDPRHHLVKELDMIPLECVGRNLVFGSLPRRVPLFEEGDPLKPPVVEFFYKSDELGDPFLNLSHIISLGILSQKEAREVQEVTSKVGKLLKKFFEKRNLLLVDYKLEFGYDSNRKLLIGDEINGDSIRVWDKEKWEEEEEIRMLDKQVYRAGKPLDEVKRGYNELCEKICGKLPE